MEYMLDGNTCYIDDDDFWILSKKTWRVYTGPAGNKYIRAASSIWKCKELKTRKVTWFHLHREILKPLATMQVDHINGNGLDNRKNNLREATSRQNKQNMKKIKRNTSGYKGVTWCKDRGKWAAYIKSESKSMFLGRFKTPTEAHEAYKTKAAELFGEYANFG